MFTRQQYLDNECTHAQYYAQYVNAGIRQLIMRTFTPAGLRAQYAQDISFNTIELREWDYLAYSMSCQKGLLAQLGDCDTLAGRVCILKECAREIATL